MRPTTDGPDRRNARGRATIRAVERAAVALAEEEGLDALTVDRICEAVGITQRSFFNHFDAKEDAILGWALPHLDLHRIDLYLADPAIGVLTGALGLVVLPAEMTEDRALLADRLRVIEAAPDLLQRQTQRMAPIAHRVEGIVAQKLATLSGCPTDAAALQRQAAAITVMAAALFAFPLPGMTPPAGGPLGRASEGGTIPRPPDPARAAAVLDELEWVWPRLL